MGPVLAFKGTDGARWSLSVLVVADGDPGQLTWTAEASGVAHAEPLWTVGGRTAFRYLFSVPLAERSSSMRYTISGTTRQVHLPGQGAAPTMAYASCNGFSSAKVMKGVRDKNAMWRRLADQHKASPYHLLLLGGDQVYADSVWEKVPLMEEWADLSWKAGNEAPATPEMQAALQAFYFDLYAERWSQPEIAEVFGSVPMIAMWDDHDIIDGWGSYPADRQRSNVYQKAIWPAARKAFATFQQQLRDGESQPAAVSPRHGFGTGHIVGPVAILSIDTRSERSHDQVLSFKHWERVFAWIDALSGVDHLILMSSIPVVYPGFDTLERLLGALPGYQDLEDDLRDHWNSRPHKGERLRLIHRLLQLAEDKEIRSTIVSGDVHVAALGYVESTRGQRGNGAVINQLISSAVVHPRPGGAVLFALRHLFDNTDEMDRGIRARMAEFPGTQDRFVGKRNFLSLEPDTASGLGRIWANWFVEGEEHTYTKVIHRLERTTAPLVVQTQSAVSTATG